MKLSRILIAVIACSSFLMAQEAAAPAPAPKAEKPAKMEKASAKKEAAMVVSGTVVSADASSLIVKTKKGEDTLAIDAAAKIMMGKKEIAATDLKADMAVTVSCKVVDGKKVATKITEKAAAKSEKTTKKTTETSTSTTTTTTEPAAAPAAAPAPEKKVESAPAAPAPAPAKK
jgi:pyruvate dehydrogenase E2 component (dihydrolipoamide acetyltransferase)